MRAQATIRAEQVGGRTVLPLLVSQTPLLLRRTPDAVHLVSGAGGPLGGDELALDIDVGPGALLRVRSAGATVALPGRAGFSSLVVRARVAGGGRLEWLPEPTVVADGADHRSRIEVALDEDAELLLREEVVLGRSGERGGRVSMCQHVTVGATPLLRSALVLSGTSEADRGAAGLAGRRCVGTLLHISPSYVGAPARGWSADAAAAMPLAGPGVLVSAVSATAPGLRRRLRLERPVVPVG